MVLEIHMKLHVTEPDFLGKKIAPKTGKTDEKWAKSRVYFELFKNLVVKFYWIP